MSVPSQDPVAAAVERAKSVVTCDGVAYAWVLDVAKGRYDAIMKAFDDLDAKAGALVGYLGGGTGLATLGTLFTVINSSVHVAVIWLTLPAILAAGCCLLFAAWARRTKEVYPPPAAADLIDMATDFAFHDDKGDKSGDRAKAAMATQWDICTAKMRPVVARKGDLVDRATTCFVVAVFLLNLPLFAAICLPKEDKGPQKHDVRSVTAHDPG